MTFLATESLNFADGHALNAHFVERSFQVIQLERFDDCLNLFHFRILLAPWMKLSVFAACDLLSVLSKERAMEESLRVLIVVFV